MVNDRAWKTLFTKRHQERPRLYLSNAKAMAVWNCTSPGHQYNFLFPAPASPPGSLLIKFIFQAGMVLALRKASLMRPRLSVVMQQESNAEIWKWDLGSASSKVKSRLGFLEETVSELSVALPRTQGEDREGADVCHRGQLGLSTVL